MNELAAMELERLAQALALVEGFQLLLVECRDLDPWDLRRCLDRVQARVAELRAAPPLILYYDPTLTTRHEGSLRDQAWVEGVLGPLRELERPASPEASLIAVIEGVLPVDLSFDDSPDRSWTYLFFRINEERNAIARSFGGTLLLALRADLVHRFLQDAPDAASIRSGHFVLQPDAVPPRAAPAPGLERWYSPALVREASLRHLLAEPRLSPEARDDLLRALMPHDHTAADEAPVPAADARAALGQLFLSLFSSDELRRFLHYRYGRELAADLPGPEAPFALVVDAALSALERRGLVDRDLFNALTRERPRRSPELRQVAALWGVDLGDQPSSPVRSGAPDLFDTLLRLTKTQREQVVLLSGLAGDATDWEVRRMSARELIALAHQRGPEAMERLTEAVHVVTARMPRA